MINNKILFRALKPWLNKDSNSTPSNTKSVMPDWYKEADRFAKNPINGEYYKATKQVCPFPKENTKDDYGYIPTWKACPSIMDAFMTGYVLKTPCDITFFKDKNNKIDVKVEDQKYNNFCTKRMPMPQFVHPKGYYREHFAWFPDWSVNVPQGYSCLYLTPMNRFDLPFLNTTGIIDNDKVGLAGSFPFFIVENWEGTIEAGTPYMQLIPFKREDWFSESEFLSAQQISEEYRKNAETYRVPDGGVYKNNVWSKREYK